MTRWSQKKYDELRQVAAESDRAMVEAARVLGLEFVPRAPHEHPLMGTIPAFGVVRGVLRGVPVKVTINVDTERGFAKTELSAELGDGPHEERLDGPSRSSERYRLERQRC